MKSRYVYIGFASLVVTMLVFLISVILCNKGVIPKSLTQFLAIDLNPIYDFYSNHIRGNLFAGMIAVGGFLMTGKTFILVTMKQNVFDDPEYKNRVEVQSKLNPKIKLLQPLIELKDILYLSVMLTIISAIVQLTIGLIPHWSMSLISLYSAILSIAMVVDSLNLIKRNLDFWINE
ncbi:hypothetical protein [Vibrio hepatarius]|uniref:hypothetical protein n=1 Tax=Vibrio hepatarius TaxID=171383 RepID=UPI00148C399B|nr:hypothetical protein [Vibrio hepatarius]NOI13736.1 hypothetical protein [Vibrio hepatarius]